MHTLTTDYPESSFLRFGVWSVLLHVVAIAMFGVLHGTRPMDHSRPLVTVTLLEPAAPVSKNAPPSLHAEQPAQPVAPQQALPPPHSAQATDAPPGTRKVLLDQHASDTLKLKNFMKAPARRTAQAASITAVPQEAQPIVVAKPNAINLWSFQDVPTPAPSTTRTTAQDAPKVFRDATADRKGLRTAARPIKKDDPPYPRIARERGWEGTVVLRLTITREGTVERADIRSSSGFPILDEQALETVQKWRFEPARDGEFAVPATVDQPVRFALADS